MTKAKKKGRKSGEESSSLFGNNERDRKKTRSSEQSLSSSIFGTASTSGEVSSLFSSSQKWQQVAAERQAKNQRNCLTKKTSRKEEEDTDINSKEHIQEILKGREKRHALTKKLVQRISAVVPEVLSDTDDEELRRGEERLFVGQCDALFQKNGVLILRSLFGKKLLKKLRTKATEIESDLCRRLDEEGKPWQAIDSQSASSRQLEQDNAFQYREVASRCFGRLDTRYKMDEQPFNSSEVVNHPWLMLLIQSLLGPQAKLVYAGLILSFPHSADQPWHQDGEALFGDTSQVGDLPPYALNVFVPLKNVTLELGPTEFWVGSHTESTCRQIMEQLQTGNESSDKIINPLLQNGDVLIYDYRICHRGTHNLSTTEVRPMLYLMYARPWFHEHLNFGTKLLFPENEASD